MIPVEIIPREIVRLRRPAVLAAVGGILLMLVGLGISREQFFRGYLVAWLFILGISMGSLAIVMLGNLVEGEWAWLVRRIGEAAAMNLVVVAALFIPILFGLKYLFPWAQPALMRGDAILQHKARYLNAPWFTIRAAIYFCIWLWLASFIRRQSIERDLGENPNARTKAQRASAAGLVIYVLTMTLASVDWIISRDAHWYSTVIGFAVVVGQGLAGMAFIVWVLMRIAGRDPFATVLEKKHLNDYGNLLLTLVILWAYMSFAQFLVIWMGNSTEDNSWYLDRGVGLHANGWRWVGLFLIVFHFFVPFLILLSRDNKRRTHFLGTLAMWLLAMRFIDIIWMVVPTAVDWHAGPRKFTVMVLPALLALGGIWLVSFIRIVQEQPLLARRDGPAAHLQAHAVAPAGGAT